MNIIELCSFLSILIYCLLILLIRLGDGRSGHVLNNQVRRAEVDEPLGRVNIGEELLEHTDQLLLSVLFVDEGLLVLDALEAGVEGVVAVLLAHVLGELVVVARSDVDHFFLFGVTALAFGAETIGLGSHGALLSVGVGGAGLVGGEGLLGLALLLLGCLPVVVTGLGQVLDVLLVLVLKELGILVEFLVTLRWLIASKVHLLHLLLSLELLHLFALFSSGLVLLSLDSSLLLLLLGLLINLLLGLDTLEFLKHVLVVKKSVREFISEVSTIEELTDAGFDERVSQDLVNSRSRSGISLKHVLNELIKLGREVTRQFRVFTLDDSLGQLMERLSVEGRLEGSHLVKQDTEGPDVRLKVVALTLDDLRGEVVRSSNDSLGSGTGVREDTSDSEISKLHDTALSQEDVLRLEITMEDLLIVSVLDSQADLSEDIKDLVLSHVVDFAT